MPVYWQSLQQINIEANKELKTNEQQEPVFTSQGIHYDGELLVNNESYVNIKVASWLSVNYRNSTENANNWSGISLMRLGLKLIQCNCITGGAEDFLCGMFS